MKSRLQSTFVITSLIVFSSCGGHSSKTDATYEIEEILKFEDPTEAIIALDTKLNEQSNYGNNIAALSDAEKVVLYVENLETEVNNGGFNQFFWNSSGDFAYETLDALKLIGANKTVEIVSRAYAEWPDTIIPKERSERQNILLKIEDRANDVWNNCDTQFFEYEEDITSFLLNYVIANKKEFK